MVYGRAVDSPPDDQPPARLLLVHLLDRRPGEAHDAWVQRCIDTREAARKAALEEIMRHLAYR